MPCSTEASTSSHDRRVRFTHSKHSHDSVWQGCSFKGSVPRRQEHPSERLADRTPVLPNAFDVDFTLGTSFLFSKVFGSICSPCNRNVHADDKRREVSLETKVPGSCNRFQEWSCNPLHHRSGRSLQTHMPVATQAVTWTMRETVEQGRVITMTLCWCEHGVFASAAAALAAYVHVQFQWCCTWRFYGLLTTTPCNDFSAFWPGLPSTIRYLYLTYFFLSMRELSVSDIQTVARILFPSKIRAWKMRTFTDDP